MRLSNFNFYLPEKLIAKEPLSDREKDRLMVLHRDTGEIEHKIFKDLPEYFAEGDVMVFNNVKIFPALLIGVKDKDKNEAEIYVQLVRELNPDQLLWEVIVNPARKIRVGNKIHFRDGLVGEIKDNTESSGRTIKFIFDGTADELKKLLKKIGKIPLPYFINRDPLKKDHEYFNHPFAKEEGAVISPTAILHFTDLLVKRLEVKGIISTEITLYPGTFNFDDITVEDLSKYKIGSEPIIISEKTAEIINKAKKEKKRICAVGTTVYKALEAAATTENLVDPYEGWISKFIFPPYETKIINALLVNFHMPKSHMLITTAAFGGFRNVMNAYETAVKEGYRFGPFGDGLLII